MGALYVMGGAERSGNSSVAAEYNFHCDPEAAHLVLLKVCAFSCPSGLPCSLRGQVLDYPFSLDSPW